MGGLATTVLGSILGALKPVQEASPAISSFSGSDQPRRDEGNHMSVSAGSGRNGEWVM